MPPLPASDRATRLAASAAALAAFALAPGCSAGPPSDPLVSRCVAVLGYEEPGLEELEVRQVVRPRGRAVLLRFEALAGPTDEPITDFIACAFRPGPRPAASQVVIGDRVLRPDELALANAELLLRDLGRGPAALGPREHRAGFGVGAAQDPPRTGRAFGAWRVAPS